MRLILPVTFIASGENMPIPDRMDTVSLHTIGKVGELASRIV